MTAALLDRPAVKRVRAALAAAGAAGEVMVLAETARTAADAAAAVGVPQGAIVKSLVFRAGDTPVLALIAGDRRCDSQALARVLGLGEGVRRADADFARAGTGYSIGGVAPLAHSQPIATAIDASLGRFATVYAAAGHPHCVFPTSLAELVALTGGIVTEAIGIAAG